MSFCTITSLWREKKCGLDLELVLHPSRQDNMSGIETTERFIERFLYTVIINMPPTSNEEKQSLILSK